MCLQLCFSLGLGQSVTPDKEPGDAHFGPMLREAKVQEQQLSLMLSPWARRASGRAGDTLLLLEEQVSMQSCNSPPLPWGTGGSRRDLLWAGTLTLLTPA